MDTDARLVRLADTDNVLMISTALNAGEALQVAGETITLPSPLSLGHKIAARAIAAGETILKYNFPIGVATADISLGAHVHVHNVRSDYTPTHLVGEA